MIRAFVQKTIIKAGGEEMSKKSKPKPQPIDWTVAMPRLMSGWNLVNPLVLPKIQAAIDLERANKGAGEKAFKDACKQVINDDKLISDWWNIIATALANAIDGYCW